MVDRNALTALSKEEISQGVGEGTGKKLFGTNDLNTAIRAVNVQSIFSIVPKQITQLRDVIVADGSIVTKSSADVSFTSGHYEVKSESTDNNNRVSFETAQMGKYYAGAVSIAGIYVRKDNPPVGKAEWGYGKDADQNALYFRYKSDGSISFVIRRGGIETEIPKSDWKNGVDKDINNENGNLEGHLTGIDAMDGTGKSGVNYDPKDGRVHRIDFAWYGGGAITPHIVGVDDDGNQRAFPVFTFEPFQHVSIDQPNQPIFVRLDNQGSSTQDAIETAGRQYSIAGDFTKETRNTPHVMYGKTLPTSPTAIAIFRRKQGLEFEGIEYEISNINMKADQDAYVYYSIRPNLSSQFSGSNLVRDYSGNEVDPSETVIEVDESTGITVGSGVQYGSPTIVTAGGGNKEGGAKRGGGSLLPIPREEPVAIIAQSTTGQSGTIDMVPVFDEKW